MNWHFSIDRDINPWCLRCLPALFLQLPLDTNKCSVIINELPALRANLSKDKDVKL